MKRHRRQLITVKDAQGDTVHASVTAEYPMSPELRAALEQVALAATRHFESLDPRPSTLVLERSDT